MPEEKYPIKRDLLLSSEVNNNTVADIMKSIYDINYDDDSKENQFKEFDRKPIILHINTNGGSCYDGWGLINTIEHSKTPIFTICEGYAMSMGLPILLSGKKRYAYRYSTMLYHEASGVEVGKLTQIKENIKQDNAMQEMIDTYILSKTNILKGKLDEVKEKKMDWFIPAEEALKLGIVDKVIE